MIDILANVDKDLILLYIITNVEDNMDRIIIIFIVYNIIYSGFDKIYNVDWLVIEGGKIQVAKQMSGWIKLYNIYDWTNKRKVLYFLLFLDFFFGGNSIPSSPSISTILTISAIC